MNDLIVPASFFGGLIAVHLIFYFVIAPFHFWMAEKMGCDYDARRNEFIPRKK